MAQYLEYVQTVFPESAFKEIVWHGTPVEERRDAFDHAHPRNKRGVSYFGEYETAAKYKGEPGRLHAVLLDLRNPYRQDPTEEWVTDQLTKEDIEEFKRRGHDGIVGMGMFGEKEVVVFSPGQIHIAGTDADLQKFKEFVSKKES